MRKLAVLLLSVLLMLSLCSCKSKEAQAVDDLILAIGEVSLESEEKIVEAETAYMTLEEKDKEKVENYSLLKEARTEYDRLVEEERQEVVDTMFDLIDSSFNAGNMDVAEGLCYELLNNENIAPRDDEISRINDYLDDISRMCFAGSYIVMPEYISGVLAEDVAGDDTIEELFDGRSMYVSYDYSSSLEVLLVFNQYKAYFDSRFNYITSDSNRNGSVKTYYYADDSNRQLMLQLFDFSPIDIDTYSINIEMANAHFDRSKIETDDMSLTIRDTDKVVKKR